jgi:hypothetical protein
MRELADNLNMNVHDDSNLRETSGQKRINSKEILNIKATINNMQNT